MPRLRLLKVVVQPVLVLDDGETLTEQVAEPIEVSVNDWPTFAAKLDEEITAANGRLECPSP
jgi:hypothetical protein